MSDYGKIKSCRDITDDQIGDAIESREDTRALLDHAAKISAPRTGGARVLLLFARMASPNCDWLDGALRVEITGDGENSHVETFAEIGAGLKERIFSVITLNVPIEEFVIAVKKFPKAIAPLAFLRPSPRKLVLTAGEVEKVERVSSVPPGKRIKTPAPLSSGDLPTVGGAKSAPPAAHIPAVVMSASQYPPAAEPVAARAPIPKFPGKTELRIGTAPKFPPPQKKKIEPLEKKPEPVPIPLPRVEPKKPVEAKKPEPVVEAKKPEPVVEAKKKSEPPVVERKKRIATMAYPVLEPPMPPGIVPPVVVAPVVVPPLVVPPVVVAPVVEPPAPETPSIPEVAMPEVADLPAPSRPLARIQLKKQQTANLPRVVEEIAAPKKRASKPFETKAFVVPPPPSEEPKEQPEKAPEEAEAAPRKKEDVDEGWE